MFESTAVGRLKCGQIFLSNNKFSLICKFCGSDSFTLDDFRTHLNEHFPDSQVNIKNEDSISCGSDSEFITPELHVKTDFTDIIKDEAFSESIDESNQIEQTEGNGDNQNEKTTEDVHSNRFPDQNIKKKSKNFPEWLGKNEKSLPIIADPELLPVLNRKNARTTGIRMKGFQCSFCCKIFTGSLACNDHENTHTGKRPYECNVCLKRFAAAANLATHDRLAHSEIVPKYQCSVCTKRFTSKRWLDAHTKAKHQPDSLYACRRCDVKLTTHSKLCYHIRITHRKNPTIFVCDYCQKRFKTKNYLRIHIIAIHSGMKPYKCNFCQKSFAWRNNTKKHEQECLSLQNKEAMNIRQYSWQPARQ